MLETHWARYRLRWLKCMHRTAHFTTVFGPVAVNLHTRAIISGTQPVYVPYSEVDALTHNRAVRRSIFHDTDYKSLMELAPSGRAPELSEASLLQRNSLFSASLNASGAQCAVVACP